MTTNIPACKLTFDFDEEQELWVHKTYLIEVLKISENTIKSGIRDFRANGKGTWQYEVRGLGDTWIKYESIPASSKQRIEDYFDALSNPPKRGSKNFSTLGELRGASKPSVYRAAIELRLRAEFEAAQEPGDVEFFLTYPIKKGGRAYTQDEAKDLALACGILRKLDDNLNKRTWRKGIRIDKGTIIKDGNGYVNFVAEVIKSWNIYGFKVGNGRVLYRKIAAWVAQDRRSLISYNFGKTNALKKTDDMMKTAIVLYGDVRKPTIRDVRTELETRYQVQLTDTTVGKWLNEAESKRKWMAAREGRVYALKKQAIYIAQGKLKYPDEMWFVDTTTVQLAVMDGNGKQVKIPMNRVTVLDGYSKKRVGVAYGVVETAELVWDALYFAFKTTGYLPNVLKSDNGGANTRKDLVAKYTLLGITHITIKPRRSTAQSDVEYDQHKHERMLQRIMPNFTGGNFMGRGQQMRFNPDNLKRLKTESKLPNWLEAIAKDYEIYFSGNSIPDDKTGLTPNQKYYNGNYPERRSCNFNLLVNVFDPLEEAHKLEHGQIIFQINGQRLKYWVGTPMQVDMDFIKRYEGNKFRIRYNPSDPSLIGLYSEKWEFVSVAVQKHEFSQNPKALTPDERAALNYNLDADKWLQNTAITAYDELKSELVNKGELTYIDWDTRLKEHVQKDSLNNMWNDIENLGILNSKGERLNTKRKQAAKQTITIEQNNHFFKDDAFANSLLD